MSKRRNIIRVNDRVKIINPEVVIRWGYPLSKQVVKDTLITREQKDSIYAVIKSFGGVPPVKIEERLDIFGGDSYDGDILLYEKIADIMAYEILRQKNYGGKERSLHTTLKESLRNKEGYISERKVVKTGTYCSGRGSYDYYGDYDYTPAYLENEKTRVLYRVYLNQYEDVCPNINSDGGIWIENKNLEKI